VALHRVQAHKLATVEEPATRPQAEPVFRRPDLRPAI